MSWNILSPIDVELYSLVDRIAKDDLASMRAIPSGILNRVCAIKGLLSPGDGSAGIYVWNFGNATDDPPVTVLPNDYATAGLSRGYWSKLV
mgnify:CR=1 FL=1